MSKQPTYFLPCPVLVFCLALSACASLPGLRPALTVAGITILQQLETLILQYEAADLESGTPDSAVIHFEASQMTLHHEIESLLVAAAAHAPPKTLAPYRARLAAVPRGSPRI